MLLLTCQLCFLCARACCSDGLLVVDPLDGWCSLWDRPFCALRIGHLRSSVLAHPCPIDAQSLRSFAARTQREQEVKPLMAADSVASSTNKQMQRKREKQIRRISKQQANARCAAQTSGTCDYSMPDASSFRRVTQSVSVWPRSALYDLSVPSAALFRDFHRELVTEARLNDMRTRDAVQQIDTVRLEDRSEWYLVTLASGRRVMAHSVVCAVGNSVPRWPTWTAHWRNR